MCEEKTPEVHYPSQTERYHRMLFAWQNRGVENPFAYSVIPPSKETSFAENPTRADRSPRKWEKAILHKIGKILGYALLVYLLVDNMVDKFVVLLLQQRGYQIDSMVFQSYIYGDDIAVFWTMLVTYMARCLVPLAILQLCFRLPASVSYPGSIRRPRELLIGVSVIMLFSTGLCALFVSRSAELQKYSLIANTTNTENGRIQLYTFCTVLVFPLLTELLLHGSMFQILRQFGNVFAMTIVAVLSAFLTGNIQDAIRIGILEFVISYFVITSGSFWTAVCLRVAHEIYMFALYYIETFGTIYSLQWWMTTLLPCVVGIAVGAYVLVTHQQSLFPKLDSTYMPLKEKIAAVLSPLPIFAFMVTAIIMMALAPIGI